MILPGVKTSGLGDVVQQGGRPDHFDVEMSVLTDQMVRKVGGHPTHLHGMDHDVIHHLHFAHHLIALCFGWDQECHR
jgi:hypothetical protein